MSELRPSAGGRAGTGNGAALQGPGEKMSQVRRAHRTWLDAPRTQRGRGGQETERAAGDRARVAGGSSWRDKDPETETAQRGHDEPRLGIQTPQVLRDPEQAGRPRTPHLQNGLTLSCLKSKTWSTGRGIFILRSAKKEKKNNPAN